MNCFNIPSCLNNASFSVNNKTEFVISDTASSCSLLSVISVPGNITTKPDLPKKNNPVISSKKVKTNKAGNYNSIENAKIAISEKQYSEAIKILEIILKSQPKNIVVKMYLFEL